MSLISGKCEDCGKMVRGTWADFGIGAYEYWGYKGVDTNFQFVSECCEAPILDETGAYVEHDPYGEDPRW
jgi:hypothetical protein